MNTEWIICPICQSKTRLRIRGDTELKNFALRVLDGCFRLCCWVIKRAQTDRPLAPSPNYGVRCHAIGGEKTCIHAAL